MTSKKRMLLWKTKMHFDKILDIGIHKKLLKLSVISTLILSILIILIILVVSINSAMKQELSSDSQALTISNSSYDFIIESYRLMNRIEKSNFERKLMGEKVVWIGEVIKISGGRVVIRIGPLKHNIARFFIFPVRDFQKGDKIEVKAEIGRISTLFGRITIDLTNPVYLQVIKVDEADQNHIIASNSNPTSEFIIVTGKNSGILPPTIQSTNNILPGIFITLENIDFTPIPSKTVFVPRRQTQTPTNTATNKRPHVKTFTPSPSITITATSTSTESLSPTATLTSTDSLPPTETGVIPTTYTPTPTPTKPPHKPSATSIPTEPIIPATPTDSRGLDLSNLNFIFSSNFYRLLILN